MRQGASIAQRGKAAGITSTTIFRTAIQRAKTEVQDFRDTAAQKSGIYAQAGETKSATVAAI